MPPELPHLRRVRLEVSPTRLVLHAAATLAAFLILTFPAAAAPAECVKPQRIQEISFSATKYPTIRRHVLDAVAAGWPRTLVVNRPGAAPRRNRLLEDVPTRDGFDRDEYPPAVGRGTGKGLVRGSAPRGWMASVQYVPSSENRSHGSTMGTKLRRFCNGTRFRYVFF